MENQIDSKGIIVNNGLILGVLGVALNLVNYAIERHINPHWSTAVISGLFFIGLIVYGIKQYKKTNRGFISWGQGVKIGVGIAIMASLISVIYNYIFTTFIEPDFMAQIMEFQNQKFLEQGMSEEAIEKANEISNKFQSPFLIAAFGIIGSAIGGFIVAAIVAAIVKKDEAETY